MPTKLTRKHFRAIAAEFNPDLRLIHPDSAQLPGYIWAIKATARAVGQFNPEFNRQKFFDACTEGTEIKIN